MNWKSAIVLLMYVGMGTQALSLTCTPLTTAGYYLSVGELEPIMAGRQQVYLRRTGFFVDYSACRQEGHLLDRQAGVLGWWIQFEQVKSLNH